MVGRVCMASNECLNNYDWSITLQGSPDICVTSVVEPHLDGRGIIAYTTIKTCMSILN